MTEEETKGLVGLGGKLIAGLPAQFLALIVVNLVFMGAFIWYVDARSRHSVDVIQQLLSSCLQQSR